MIDCDDAYLYKVPVHDEKLLKGTLHITASSVVLEMFTYEIPVVQYYYKHMFKAPCQDPDFLETIIFSTWEMKFLPDMALYQTPVTETLSALREISFNPLFESPAKVVETISNCYLKAKNNGWVVRKEENLEMLKNRNKFDYTQIENINEKSLIREAIYVTRVLPYERVPGWLFITDAKTYFQPIIPVNKLPVKVIQHTLVKSVLKRRWILRSVSIELFLENKSFFFAFPNEKSRDEAFSCISSQVKADSETEETLDNMTEKWQLRQISNFAYLLYLNTIANRTFCDYSQYPVFPWVLSNYTSSKIDLEDPQYYRDLSKPIGALNLERLAGLKIRVKELPEPKFLYGTHYSNPAIIIRWLIRKYPLYALNFQGSNFDNPNRLFRDISTDWNSCLVNGNDFRELIPEFYQENVEFLMNFKKLDLGMTVNGEKVAEIKLPAWASSEKEFLSTMRKALESEFVSENLHHWIDLIFGYKQRGEQAIFCNNWFHIYSYEGGVDLDLISDPETRKRVELQIQEYGQTPKQLFKVPHPPRNSIQSLDPPVKYVHKYWKAEAITRKPKSEVHETQVHSRRVTSVYKFEGKTISTSIDGDIGISGKKITVQRPIHTSALSHSGILYLSTNDSIIIANLTTSKVISEFKAHEARISALQCASSDVLVTGSWDNTLKLWDMRTRPKSVFKTTAFNEVTCVVCDVFNPNLATCGDMQGRLTQIDFRKGVVQWEDISECIFALQDLGQEGILACGSEKTEVIKENDREKYLDFGGVQTAVSDSIVIYIGKEGQELQLWQFQGNLCLFKWDEICNVTCVTSENGEVLAGNIEGKLFQIN